MSNPFHKTKYTDLLLKFGVSYVDIMMLEKLWKQPWRFYHNLDHLNDILTKIESLSLDETDYIILVISAFFHDAQYLPWDLSENENASIAIFRNSLHQSDKKIIDNVCSIIESTKHRTIPNKRLNKLFWEIDNSILYDSNIIDLIAYEHKIFKEFQFVDYKIYKSKRIQFLQSCLGKENSSNIELLIEYINKRVINIGVYCGSFSPLTIGHLNVIEKSEQIFDKVIIARGVNTDKGTPEFLIPTDFRQVDSYEGLMSKYIESMESDNVNLTLIRGLRNGHDLDYEVNQLRHITKLKPNLKTIFINCDKEVEEISSSSVRALLKIGDQDATKLANTYIYNGIKNHL